jgi:hypothetical protein
MLCVILTGLLCPPLFAKDKRGEYDADNFPLVAQVLTSNLRTVSTGATVHTNPACVNPQGGLMQGFCPTDGSTVSDDTHSSYEVQLEMENVTYTLSSRDRRPVMLAPHAYHVRRTKHGFDVLYHSQSGPKIASYGIIGMSADAPK